MSNSEQFNYFNFFYFLQRNFFYKSYELLDKDNSNFFLNDYIFDYIPSNEEEELDPNFEEFFNSYSFENEDEKESKIEKTFNSEYIYQIHSLFFENFQNNPAFLYYFPFLPIFPYNTKDKNFQKYLFEKKEFPLKEKDSKKSNFFELPYLLLFLTLYQREANGIIKKIKYEKSIKDIYFDSLEIIFSNTSVELLKSKKYCNLTKILNEIKKLIDKNTFHNLFIKTTLKKFLYFLYENKRNHIVNGDLVNFKENNGITGITPEIFELDSEEFISSYLKFTHKYLLYTLDIPIQQYQVKRSSIVIKNQKKLLKLLIEFIILLEDLELPKDFLPKIHNRIDEELSREKLLILTKRNFIASDTFIEDFKKLMSNFFNDEDICAIKLERKNITYSTIASLIGELLFYKDFPFINQEKLRKKIIGIINKIHKELKITALRKRDFEKYRDDLKKSSISLIPFKNTGIKTDEFTFGYFLQLLEEIKLYDSLSAELKFSIYNNLTDCINSIKKEKKKNF